MTVSDKLLNLCKPPALKVGRHGPGRFTPSTEFVAEPSNSKLEASKLHSVSRAAPWTRLSFDT